MANERQFELIGGHPLIDFVNTEKKHLGMPTDLLKNEQDLATWLVECGLIKGPEQPFSESADLLDQVRKFRQQMRLMMVKLRNTGTVSETTITLLNKLLLERRGQLQIQATVDGCYIRQFDYEIGKQPELLGALADMAAQFLETVNFRYLKLCESKMCTRFFLDTSRNHSRRWCSMQTCGNRMKARAYYARKTRSAAGS